MNNRESKGGYASSTSPPLSKVASASCSGFDSSFLGNPGIAAAYGRKSPACTLTSNRVQASSCGLEMRSEKRYGVSWSPPGPCSICRRFWSSKLVLLAPAACDVRWCSRRDDSMATEVDRRTVSSPISCTDAPWACSPLSRKNCAAVSEPDARSLFSRLSSSASSSLDAAVNTRMRAAGKAL